MTISNHIKSFLLAASLLTISSKAVAEFKLATVDVNRVLNESSEALSKRKELDLKSAEARKKLEEKGKRLRQIEEQIKSGSLSEDSKEAQKYRSEAREFSRELKDAEDELKTDFMKVNKTLAEKALKIIAEYAKANGIDLILDKGEKAKGPVLYGVASQDITDAIVKKMNQ